MSVLKVVFMIICALGGMASGRIQKLVYGGRFARVEDSPYVALYLGYSAKGVGRCGATILTKKFLLSAAHCYHENEGFVYSVTVGTDHFDAGDRYDIKKTIVHPKYQHSSNDYDVLILKLWHRLKYSAKIQPIKMANSKLVIKDGAMFDTFGFGMTEHGLSPNLRRVSVPYVQEEKCRAAYNYTITDRMICAGEKGKDSCWGDSGGPLVYDNVLVGVVSFGRDCGHPDFPGVYAKVSTLRKFIDYVIKNM